MRLFLEKTSFASVFAAMLGATVDTYLRQFMKAICANLPIFYVPVDLGRRDLALFVPNAWLDAGFMFNVSSQVFVDFFDVFST